MKILKIEKWNTKNTLLVLNILLFVSNLNFQCPAYELKIHVLKGVTFDLGRYSFIIQKINKRRKLLLKSMLTLIPFTSVRFNSSPSAKKNPHYNSYSILLFFVWNWKTFQFLFFTMRYDYILWNWIWFWFWSK